MLEEISRLLTAYEGRIFSDLEKIVNINSFSSNSEGIEQTCQALQETAASLGVKLERIYSPHKERPHLIYGRDQKEHFYALMGHFDTVHPPESDFKILQEEEGILRGPGTNDMKSGLIVALYALAILQQIFPGKTLPLKALFNSDEEIGSPDSVALIRSVFVGAKAGFVFEPGRRDGNSVVTQRKGILSLEIEIAGKPSHSGTAPWSGVNAISEAASLIQLLDGLSDHKRGLSVGCNTIQGGIASNVVAPECRLGVDVRYREQRQREEILSTLEARVAKPVLQGATLRLRILHSRPPMEKSSASDLLFSKYRAVSESLGIPCSELASGGVSDANFLADMGIPVIDGIGAVGEGSHTREEYTVKHSIPDRIKIFCLLMAQEIQNS